MLSMEFTSPRRMLPLAVRSRVSLYFTASAFEFFPVLELHAVAKVNHQMRRILPFISGRKHGHDVQVGVDVEQLVAKAGKYDAADIGGAERRIEQIGILAQTDMQDAILRQRSGSQ